MENNKQNQTEQQLPVNKVEDVEFAMENAAQEDLEALARAEQADQRQES